jgi:hypothetical protein
MSTSREAIKPAFKVTVNANTALKFVGVILREINQLETNLFSKMTATPAMLSTDRSDWLEKIGVKPTTLSPRRAEYFGVAVDRY